MSEAQDSVRHAMDRLPGDYTRLKELCIANPSDKQVRSAFIGTYLDLAGKNGQKPPDEEGELVYLKLESLYGTERWKPLAGLGRIYLDKSKKELAFMCFSDSLRLNPSQKEVFQIARELERSERQAYPKAVKPTTRVSVIMRTFDRRECLRESIRSVLGQTFPDFELVVINDGGDKGLKEIVESFASPKIRYYRLKKNEGRSAALNQGVLQARGEYITYLDDDDIYYPRHLETLLGHAEGRKKQSDVVYTNSWWCYGQRGRGGFLEASRKLYDIRPVRFDRDLLFHTNYIATLNILHRRACFLGTGLFNEDLTALEDWDMWVRLAKEFTFLQVDEITGEYRWHEGNVSRSNLLEMAFLWKIVKCYHEFDCGRVALMKWYAQDGHLAQAREIFETILEDCVRMAQSPSLAKELFLMAGRLNIEKTGRTITRTYFGLEPRNCLRELVHSRRMADLASLIPVAPWKITTSLAQRFTGYLHHKDKYAQTETKGREKE